MRRFIEILKEQTEEEATNGVPQEMIRVAVVDDLPDADILTKIDNLRAQVGWTETEAPSRVHYCAHGPGDNQPCSVAPEREIRDQVGG